MATEGNRSAGVAYIDLAVGNTDALMGEVRRIGDAVAKALSEAVSGTRGNTPKIINAEAVAEQGREAGEEAAKALNDALTSDVNGKDVGQKLASDLATAASRAGEEVAAALDRALSGEGMTKFGGGGQESTLSQLAERVGEIAGDSFGKGIESAVETAEDKTASTWDDFGRGLSYQVGAWGLGYAVSNEIIQGFEAVKNAIFGFNAEMEQANVSFTTLLGGGGKVETFIDQLKEFAKVTPFDFEGLVSDAQRMLAMGIPLEQIKNDLTAIGDATSAMGGSDADLQSLVNIFSEMSAKGQVMEVQLRQLEIRGVNAAAILANSYGVTAAQFEDMVSKGQILAQDAIPKLVQGIEKGTSGLAGTTKALGGEMTRQAKTFEGALSNIHDYLEDFAATAFRPLFDGTKGIAVAIEKGLDGPGIKRFGDDITRQLNDAGVQLKDFGKIALDVGKATVAVLSPVIGALDDVEHALGPVGFTASAIAIIFADKFNGAMSSFVGKVKQSSSASKDLASVFGDVYAKGTSLWEATQYGTEAYGRYQTALGTVKAAFQGAGAETDGFKAKLTGTMNAAKGLATIGLQGILSIFGGPWGIALTAATFGVSLLTEEFAKEKQQAQETKDAIAALTKGYRELGNHATFQQIQDFVDNLSDSEKRLAYQVEAGGLSLKDYLNALTGNKDAIKSITGQLDKLIETERAKAVADTTYGQQAQANIDAARKMKQEILDQVAANSKNADLTQAVADAMGVQADAANGATNANSVLATALRTLEDDAANADDKLKALKDAIDSLLDPSLSLGKDVDELHSKLNDMATQGLKGATGAAGNFSKANIDLRGDIRDLGDQLVQYYQDQYKATGSVTDAKAAFDEQVTAVKNTLRQMGLLTPAVEALINEYAKVPAQIDTKVRADTSDALASLQRLIDKANAANSRLQSIGGRPVPRAAGGIVYGPGSSTSDSIPAMLSNGEFVVKADAVKAYGANFLSAVNSMTLPRSLVRGYGNSTVPHVPMAASVPSASMSGPVAAPSLAGARVIVQVGEAEFEGYVAAVADGQVDSRLTKLTQRFNSR